MKSCPICHQPIPASAVVCPEWPYCQPTTNPQEGATT